MRWNNLAQFKPDGYYEDDDDNLDHQRKKQISPSESRPTRNFTSIHFANTDRSQGSKNLDELEDDIIRNFAYTHRKELGNKIQFSDTKAGFDEQDSNADDFRAKRIYTSQDSSATVIVGDNCVE